MAKLTLDIDVAHLWYPKRVGKYKFLVNSVEFELTNLLSWRGTIDTRITKAQRKDIIRNIEGYKVSEKGLNLKTKELL